MILDSQLQFSATGGDALTASADSTNVIDLGLDRDIGIGEPMAVMISVQVAAGGTSPTFTFQVETDDNDSISSSTVIASSTVLEADLQLGDKVVIPLGHLNERYLQLRYVLGGTSPTLTVDAYLVPLSMVDGTRDYTSGYSIS